MSERFAVPGFEDRLMVGVSPTSERKIRWK
jgi:hypothetical protein